MRNFVSLGALFLAGCSLPTAVSQGIDDLSNQYKQDQLNAQIEMAKDNKYGLDSNTNRALVAFTKGAIEESQEYATLALQENPQDVYALMTMAIINDSQGLTTKAAFYYQAVVDTKQDGLTTLGNYRLNMPNSLYESAHSRLKVLDIKQAPFSMDKGEVVNSATQPLVAVPVYTAQPNNEEVSMVVKTGMDLFDANERNIISRFLTLKALAEAGYITKEEFISRRDANVGGLLPMIKPVPASTVILPVPSTEAVVDRFNSMKNAYELKSMSADEYIAERDVILEALLPLYSLERMNPTMPPKDLIEGADEVRKLEVLRGLELITQAELDAEKSAIESILKMGGKPLPTSTPKKVEEADKSGMPMPLIPLSASTNKNSSVKKITRKSY